MIFLLMATSLLMVSEGIWATGSGQRSEEAVSSQDNASGVSFYSEDEFKVRPTLVLNAYIFYVLGRMLWCDCSADKSDITSKEISSSPEFARVGFACVVSLAMPLQRWLITDSYNLGWMLNSFFAVGLLAYVYSIVNLLVPSTMRAGWVQN